jgi:uncharacterized membrane protein
MDDLITLVAVLVALVLFLLPATIANGRGRSGIGWFLFGLFIGPLFAIILVLLLPPLDGNKEETK